VRVLNALSVDVEDWYHPELIRDHLSGGESAPRVEQAIGPILELLARYQVRATFFVVGGVAGSAPELVHEIAAAGHEIGCHGMSHRPLWDLQPEEFRRELGDFARATSGLPRTAGFRAPTFSLDQRTRWAVPILRECGYEYDSSIFPLRNYLYGVADCPPTPYPLGESDVTCPDPSSGLWEFPMSVARWGRIKLPVSGGFYLRATPVALLRPLLKRINARDWPFVVYVHPWETDAGTPRLRNLPLLSRWVTYWNIAGALDKLERLLQTFAFAPLQEVLTEWRKAHPGG
jgi:polysaccharide deacetylase family protein (PEP-CTERM system associated)